MITVSLSTVCQELRPLILSLLEKQVGIGAIEDRINEGQIVLTEEDDLQKVMLLINDIFSKTQRLDSYVLAENSEDQNDIAVLKKGDVQQL